MLRSSRDDRGATGFVAACALSLLLFAAPANAFVIDWDQLVPDVIDVPNQTFTVNDADGSGIGFTAVYSGNMFGQQGFPDVYSPADAPIPEIEGTLRFTNDRSNPIEVTSITLTFTEAIFLETSMVSHSIILDAQEHTIVEAFDVTGAAVLASAYGTLSPGLVALDMDGDAAYETVGTGFQSAGEYGNAFYEYNSGGGVTSIRFSLFVSPIGGDTIAKGFGSVGVGDFEFTPVPEPTTALLLGAGIVGLALHRRR